MEKALLKEPLFGLAEILHKIFNASGLGKVEQCLYQIGAG